MANLCQPQGVILTIALAVAATAGFYPVELIEDGQTTIPNLVNIDGTGNTGDANLLVNDGLLRTHQDSMIFAVDNTGGTDLNLVLYVAKQPITNLAAANENPDLYLAARLPVAIKAEDKRHLELRLINGQYVLADRALDLATV